MKKNYFVPMVSLICLVLLVSLSLADGFTTTGMNGPVGSSGSGRSGGGYAAMGINGPVISSNSPTAIQVASYVPERRKISEDVRERIRESSLIDDVKKQSCKKGCSNNIGGSQSAARPMSKPMTYYEKGKYYVGQFGQKLIISWREGLARIGQYDHIFKQAGRAHGIDPRIIKTMGAVESGGDPEAKGRAGEKGLMQLKPRTAQGVGLNEKDLFDPYKNIMGGTQYLIEQIQDFGSLPKGLLAYNMGPGDARLYLASGRRAEDHIYVKKVLAALELPESKIK